MLPTDVDVEGLEDMINFLENFIIISWLHFQEKIRVNKFY